MINFGTGLIKIKLSWQDFKDIVNSKKLLIQYIKSFDSNVTDEFYTIFSIDDNIVYITYIFCNNIPENHEVNQEINDLNKLDFEINYKNNANQRLSPTTQGADKALKVSSVGREGIEIAWSTHNFCDPTSWYNESTRRIDVQLTSSDGGYTFYESGSIKSWIDLYNGKVLHEDKIRLNANGYYDVIIKENGILKSLKDCIVQDCQLCQGDYVVDFNSGSIKFNNKITGSVIATFCEPNSAWWVLQPREGMILTIEGAEMQFSEDVDLKDNIVMQLRGYVQVFAPDSWEGNGGPLPTNEKIVLAEYQYKSLAEFVDETEGAYPLVPNIGGTIRGLKSPMYGMPFAYKTTRELNFDYGMEIRIGLKHNHAFGGSRATATFYCVEKKI